MLTPKQILLCALLLTEIIYLIIYHNAYFAIYMHTVILVFLFVAVYFGYQRIRITESLPAKGVKLKSESQYQFILETQRRKEISNLMNSKQLQEIMRQRRSQSTCQHIHNIEEQLKELTDKQEQIFDI